MAIDTNVSDAKVMDVLTKYASISDYCLVGGAIYVLNGQARWSVLKLRDDGIAMAACRLLPRVGARQFASEAEWLDWARTVPVAGGFLYDRQGFRFTEATCAWRAGALSVVAMGTNCELNFADIPFPSVEHISDLEECDWPSNYVNGIGQPGAAASHWTVVVDGRCARLIEIWFDCGTYRSDPETLNIFFQGAAEGLLGGGHIDISGSLYCRVVA